MDMGELVFQFLRMLGFVGVILIHFLIVVLLVSTERCVLRNHLS